MTNSETGTGAGQNPFLFTLEQARIARIVIIATFTQNRQESSESSLLPRIVFYAGFQWRRAGVREVLSPARRLTNSETGDKQAQNRARIPMKPP